MPTAAFNIGLNVAIEHENNGVAPQTSSNPWWWQGGKWIPITTDGLPSLQDRTAIIFAPGAAGNRNRNNRAPVQGRLWSDGGFSFPVTEDFIGLLLYCALGNASTNEVPSTDATLASGAEIALGTSNWVDLAGQPSDGGAILSFDFNETTSDAGWISISGITADGIGASEVVSFASGGRGRLYSRNSWSAIGPSSITCWSDADATLIVKGTKYWEHTFTTALSNPSIAIERHGDPSAGAASKTFMHTSMVLMDLTLNTPADQVDGIFTGTANFEGPPTATCNAASLAAASGVEVWPAWGLSVTRDGVAWNRALNVALTLEAGNRTYRAAAGAQGPQGTFYGPREVTGAMQVILDDEEEFNRWRGASAHSLVFNWQSSHKLQGFAPTLNRSLSGSFMSTFLENVDKTESDDMIVMSTDFRTVDDADSSVAKFLLINGVPGTAYNTGVE